MVGGEVAGGGGVVVVVVGVATVDGWAAFSFSPSVTVFVGLGAGVVTSGARSGAGPVVATGAVVSTGTSRRGGSAACRGSSRRSVQATATATTRMSRPASGAAKRGRRFGDRAVGVVGVVEDISLY